MVGVEERTEARPQALDWHIGPEHAAVRPERFARRAQPRPHAVGHPVAEDRSDRIDPRGGIGRSSDRGKPLPVGSQLLLGGILWPAEVIDHDP